MGMNNVAARLDIVARHTLTLGYASMPTHCKLLILLTKTTTPMG